MSRVSPVLHSSWAADILRCNICYDKYKDPRVLPCLHSFCELCLSSHVEINASFGAEEITFTCPTCREDILLPDQGIQGFRRDFRVTQFEDVLNRQSSGPSVGCQFCQEGAAGDFCKDCSKFICLECSEKHREKAVFREHQVALQMDRSSSNSLETCRVHRQEKVQYVCRTCHASICSICIMTSFHDDHDVLDLASGLDHYADRFSYLRQELEDRTAQLNRRLSALEDRRVQVHQHRETAARKVCERVEGLIDSLRKQQKTLLQETDERCRQRLQRMDHEQQELQASLTEMSSIADLCSSFSDRPQLASMIPVYGDLCDRIRTMLSPDEPPAKPQTLESEGQGSTEELPNSMHLPHVSLQARVGRLGASGGEFDSPRDVAFLENDSFVVADTNNNRLQVFNRDGLLVSVIGEGQIKPWGVTATPEGHIAVADNFDKCIKIYRANGILLASVGKLLCPCGLAVNSRGEFVVTDFFSTSAFVLSPQGALLQQFEVRTSQETHTCGASRVAVDRNDRITISDVSNACLKFFSPEGQLLRTVTEDIIAPQGVCFDHFNRLLVADALKMDVLVFTPDGDLLGSLMDPKHRLRDATGLDVSKSSIVVTQLKSNQVKVCHLNYDL